MKRFCALRAMICGANYSATIASVGQEPSQAPQSTQAGPSITQTAPSFLIASTGHVPTQTSQPTHLLSSILCAIFYSLYFCVAEQTIAVMLSKRRRIVQRAAVAKVKFSRPPRSSNNATKARVLNGAKALAFLRIRVRFKHKWHKDHSCDVGAGVIEMC
jgi:hypothetical protein